MLESFHPAVRTWFDGRFPAGPTEPQVAGWREIAAGRHTLIAAPTGSGKTLAAFLVCIDQFYRAHDSCCQHDLFCGHADPPASGTPCWQAEGTPRGPTGGTPLAPAGGTPGGPAYADRRADRFGQD
ncbi:MAG: DEAD/DEAH box helicase, partial [Actinobacteria bacterium]|nr:DEAD/DEAH box helicase [Actinomycetota bacterium]